MKISIFLERRGGFRQPVDARRAIVEVLPAEL